MKLFAIAITAAILLTGCQSDNNHGGNPDALAVVYGESLTRSQLQRVLPGGMTPQDSTAYARAYIRRWIGARLIEHIADHEVDIEQIDRLTAEYRLNLIMSQYRRAMATQAQGQFATDSLRSYYNSHKAEFALERPWVKGVYIKVPANAANLRTLRRLYTSSKAADMDALEKEAPKTAIHYDYFRERWVDWEQIETRIPSDIPSADTFLHKGKPLDVTSDGFVYLLHISDYLPTGSPLPFEAAEPLVRERLLTLSRQAYDAELLRDLYDRAVADGTVVFPSGSPLEPVQ